MANTPGVTRGGYGAPDVVTPAAQLQQAYKGLYQIKQMLDSYQVGTPEYNKYKKAYQDTKESIAKLEAADKTSRAAATKKEDAGTRNKLEADYQRAQDYGTVKEQTDAKAKLDAFDKKKPAAFEDTPEGKIAADKAAKAKVDADAKAKAAADAKKKADDLKNKNGTVSGTGTGTGTSTTVKPGTTVKDDGKSIWIDALTATFKHGIDDPTEQKQITDLITKAKANSWTEETFMSALKSTSWWAKTAPTLRDYFIQTHDPRNASTFAQTMTNKMDTINAAMGKLGITISGVDAATGKVIDNTKNIKELASLALQNGWDDNQIEQYLAKKSDLIFTGGGAIGSYVDQIKRQGLNYGISFDANSLATMQRDLLNPTSGKDATWYLNNIKQKAIDANPAFAASLKEGRTLYDVTSSYRDRMSQLLEVDPTNITWNDLMGKVNKPDGTVSNLADFTKTVKQDPLWQYTKNAKETYSNMAVDLMKQFGFMG
jgi:hypothetical protein